MIKKILSCFFIIGLGSLSAQTFTGKINPYPSVVSQADDTIRILAVIADFQEDKDGSTYGNGKFGSIYTSDYGSGIIDPLPHNPSYFENHLQFVKNYYSKVSGGTANITFTVLPDVITLSKTMRNYSPAPKSDDLSPIADFAKEVWDKADSIYNDFNFAGYDLFLVFHAGVGRDVSLPGSLGLERDIPSVYLSPEALTKIYNGSFDGFPVNSGTFNIRNSAVIPETESRELSSSISGTFLFELSINGLLVASVASYLGLPDLFDTETGLSAIGRFGLMDGQSIFAYNGLFPPQPSPWEKYFLGWITPSEASLDKSNYSLVPDFSAGTSDTTVLKINISSSEYYLMENRQRDVNGDGSKVSYISQGVLQTKTFLKDTTGFYSFDIDSLEGVVIDVDEFDWALPGSGILIWHIDENIISDKLAENKVNADENNRGVDVEEADGVQDIGVEFQTVFGDIIVGEGEQRDFWYSSNNSDLYQNRFSSDTRPNTMTNSGANSLVTIMEFSDIANRMSFNVVFGDTIIKPITANNLNFPFQNTTLSSFDEDLIINSPGVSVLVSPEGNILDTLPGFSIYKPAVLNTNRGSFAIGVNEDIVLYEKSSGTSNLYKAIGNLNFQGPGLTITCSPVALNSQEKILVARSNGVVYSYILGETSNLVLTDSVVFPEVNQIFQITADENYFSILARKGNNYSIIDKAGIETILDVVPDQMLLTKNSAGEYVYVVSSEDKILVLSKGKTTVIQKENPGTSGIAITDLKQDGNNYLVFNDGSKLKVYNFNGASAENFPFIDPLGKNFDKYILAADFEGNSASEILAITVDGRIFSIDGNTGKVIKGFPLSAGKKLNGYPLIYNSENSTYLSVLDTSNTFYTWNISSIPGKLYWSELLGNNANTAFGIAAQSTNFVNEFFPSGKVYNYPNPVYDGRTYIRYYVAENSKVNIKIFDLAGSLVEEFNSDAQGGSDNETEWNVSDIQSGVYLARVEASNSSGKKETNFIKIAVVK